MLYCMQIRRTLAYVPKFSTSVNRHRLCQYRAPFAVTPPPSSHGERFGDSTSQFYKPLGTYTAHLALYIDQKRLEATKLLRMKALIYHAKYLTKTHLQVRQVLV